MTETKNTIKQVVWTQEGTQAKRRGQMTNPPPAPEPEMPSSNGISFTLAGQQKNEGTRAVEGPREKMPLSQGSTLDSSKGARAKEGPREKMAAIEESRAVEGPREKMRLAQAVPTPPPRVKSSRAAAPRKKQPEKTSMSASSKPAKPVANTPAAQSRALAETVMNSMVDRLTAEAERKGGQLTIADLKAMDQEFAKKTEALTAVFEKTFEEYVKTRERAAWDQERQYPFDRLVVKRFSHLFPGEGPEGTPIDKHGVSRRVLPGVLMALGMMLGPEVVEKYQERCRRVVELVKRQTGDDFTWAAVYDNQDGTYMVMDALASVAFHFQDVPKRCRWFQDLINSHLGPPHPAKAEKHVPPHWQLDDIAFHRMLDGLFGDLKANTRSQQGLAVLAERYGKANSAQLIDIFKRMDDERRKVEAAG